MLLNKKIQNKAAFIYIEGIVGNFDDFTSGKNSFSFCLGAREALWSLKKMNYELFLIIDSESSIYIRNSSDLLEIDKHIKNDLLIHGIKIDKTYFSSDFSKELIRKMNIDISKSIVVANRTENLAVCSTFEKLNGYLLYQNCCLDKGNIHFKEGGLFELIDAISHEKIIVGDKNGKSISYYSSF